MCAIGLLRLHRTAKHLKNSGMIGSWEALNTYMSGVAQRLNKSKFATVVGNEHLVRKSTISWAKTATIIHGAYGTRLTRPGSQTLEKYRSETGQLETARRKWEYEMVYQVSRNISITRSLRTTQELHVQNYVSCNNLHPFLQKTPVRKVSYVQALGSGIAPKEVTQSIGCCLWIREDRNSTITKTRVANKWNMLSWPG